MTNLHRRGRLAVAGILAAAALGAAAPVQAARADKAERCETVEQFEARFREIEERRGYEAAVAWWNKRWPRYHDTCLLP